MQNGKSRIKRVASAIIAGVMALQTVAPVISYADDTASSVATTDDSDAIANVDPGTPVQVDATASKEPSEAPSSGASQADENSEETETNSDITDESYTKKKLSERMAHLSSGEVVQRDLYSAFLLEHIDTESLEYNTEALKSAFPAFLKMHENTKKHLQKEENNLPASVGF